MGRKWNNIKEKKGEADKPLTFKFKDTDLLNREFMKYSEDPNVEGNGKTKLFIFNGIATLNGNTDKEYRVYSTTYTFPRKAGFIFIPNETSTATAAPANAVGGKLIKKTRRNLIQKYKKISKRRNKKNANKNKNRKSVKRQKRKKRNTRRRL